MLDYLKLEDMPGPTDEARRLQHQQYGASDALYDALNAALARSDNPDRQAAYAAAREDATFKARLADYEATVSALQALLGPQAHCCEVDSDLWSTYSDCYKSEHGIRPRFHRTPQQVREYLDVPRQASTEAAT